MNLIKSLTKRTSVEAWEMDLLLKIFALLPDDYSRYGEQIKGGLIKGVLLSDNPIPNYVNFTFEAVVPDGANRTTGLKYNYGDDIRQKFTGYQKDDDSKTVLFRAMR